MVLHSTPDCRRSRSRTGFTLLELMVVILIIAIMSGIILTAVGGNDEGQKLNAGITRLRSAMSLAQSAAISRKQTTRLLIHFDNNDPEKFLRFLTIVYLDEGDPSTTADDEWKAYTDGEFLPSGVYFSPALSSSSSGAAPLEIWEATFDANLNITSPDNTTDDSNSNYSLNGNGFDTFSHSPGANKWYAYEFAPNGTFSSSGMRCVVIDGVMRLSGSPALIIPNEDPDEIYERAQGFVIFRSGKPMFFQDAAQIKDGNS